MESPGGAQYETSWRGRQREVLQGLGDHHKGFCAKEDRLLAILGWRTIPICLGLRDIWDFRGAKTTHFTGKPRVGHLSDLIFSKDHSLAAMWKTKCGSLRNGIRIIVRTWWEVGNAISKTTWINSDITMVSGLPIPHKELLWLYSSKHWNTRVDPRRTSP